MKPQKNNVAFRPQTLIERLGICVDRVGGKRALASNSLVSEAQLFRYLNGATDITSDKLLSVAKAAKVDPGWLLTGEGDMLSGVKTDPRPSFRGELLVQITQLFEELLVEFEKPFNPRQRARAITFLYNALRHEETMRGVEYNIEKFDILKYVNFLSEIRTDEELELLTKPIEILEYKDPHQDLSKEDIDILRSWVNLSVRGTKSYYSSYSGQVYFERKSGGQLEPSAVLDLQNLVVQACTLNNKTELDWLDLGCGNGRHLLHLHQHFQNVHIHGVELSKMGFDMCNELMEAERLPANSVKFGDMRKLTFPAANFDVVYAELSLNALPYIPNTNLGMEEAMQEIARVLRSGGLLKASFPLGNWRDYSLPFQFMNETTVRQLAETFHFEVLSISHVELPAAPLRWKHTKFLHVIMRCNK